MGPEVLPHFSFNAGAALLRARTQSTHNSTHDPFQTAGMGPEVLPRFPFNALLLSLLPQLHVSHTILNTQITTHTQPATGMGPEVLPRFPFNAGVALLNLPRLRESYDDFLEFIFDNPHGLLWPTGAGPQVRERAGSNEYHQQ